MWEVTEGVLYAGNGQEREVFRHMGVFERWDCRARGLFGPVIVRHRRVVGHRELSGAERFLAKRVAGCGRLSGTGGLPGANNSWARKVARGSLSPHFTTPPL